MVFALDVIWRDRSLLDWIIVDRLLECWSGGEVRVYLYFATV